jgi:hypothetical protein
MTLRVRTLPEASGLRLESWYLEWTMLKRWMWRSIDGVAS